MVVLSIINVFIQKDGITGIIAQAIAVIAYAYVFFAVQVKSPHHMHLSSIALGVLVLVSVTLTIVSAALANAIADETVDLTNRGRILTPDERKQVVDLFRKTLWILAGISVTVNIIFAAFIIHNIQKLKCWTAKMAQFAQPESDPLLSEPVQA